MPLYSHAKWWRFHTSAQPSPPVSLRAPRSKQYVSPVGSASAGVGSPSSRHTSMKCSCEAERSFNSAARHLAMNSYGVMDAFSVADDDRHGYDGRTARPAVATAGIVGPASVSTCSPASRLSAPLRPRFAGQGLDAGSAHARPDWPLDDDAPSHAPFRSYRPTCRHRTGCLCGPVCARTVRKGAFT